MGVKQKHNKEDGKRRLLPHKHQVSESNEIDYQWKVLQIQVRKDEAD